MPALIKPYILIVDDNPFNRELISEVANAEGFLVIEAKDGKEAISNIKKTNFSLVMLDLLMPGMDGFETAKTIREMGITVPIVAVSALTMKQDRQHSLRSGCNDFLPKPVNIKKLRSLLQKYIKDVPLKQKPISPLIDKDAFILSPSNFKGLNLVLVEENEHLRKQYSNLLIEAGFQVQGVANGSDALNYIENRVYNVHIIISNIFTSGIDGLGLLTIVKRKFAHILVFLYTESYDTSTFQYAVQQKVDGIIPKDQFETAAPGIIESALSQSSSKGSRMSEAETAQMVRHAQDQLIHPGCINLCPSLDVAYQALHEAGGDMMRCHRFGLDGKCGIVLADVAGHNVMSSYTSAIFTGILTSFWDTHKDPLALLKKINQELIKVGNDKSHICATAVVWDRWSGRLEIASAGNPGGLMVSVGAHGNLVYKNLAGGGMVLGALENSDLFISDSEQLDQDVYLFLFSDGIDESELMNAVGNMPQLFDAASIKGICQHLMDNILEKKEPEDDLILLCVHNKAKCDTSNLSSEFLSTYEEVDRACIWVGQKLTDDAIPNGNDKDLVLLCIREGLLNAVEHGNNYKSTAHFEVSLDFTDHQLRINISDEGRGFNLKENLLKSDDLTMTQIGKRGLSFMNSIAHKIVVKGRRVTLIFNKIKI
ncbi:MAG: response regulator [Thermodesulfobacteriota bacterium]|nr:response regulator [Thermodesulfobacteriota bacterium]